MKEVGETGEVTDAVPVPVPAPEEEEEEEEEAGTDAALVLLPAAGHGRVTDATTAAAPAPARPQGGRDPAPAPRLAKGHPPSRHPLWTTAAEGGVTPDRPKALQKTIRRWMMLQREKIRMPNPGFENPRDIPEQDRHARFQSGCELLHCRLCSG